MQGVDRKCAKVQPFLTNSSPGYSRKRFSVLIKLVSVFGGLTTYSVDVSRGRCKTETQTRKTVSRLFVLFVRQMRPTTLPNKNQLWLCGRGVVLLFIHLLIGSIVCTAENRPSFGLEQNKTPAVIWPLNISKYVV